MDKMAIEGVYGYKPLPDGFIQTLNEDTSSLLIVFYVPRDGAPEWSSYLEKTFYPPGTLLNKQFDIMSHEWGEWPWVIVRIPLQDRAKAEAACQKTNMRLADGVPWLVENTHGVRMCINVRKPPRDVTVVKRFPLQSRRTFTLENVHPEGSPGISGVVILPKGREL